MSKVASGIAIGTLSLALVTACTSSSTTTAPASSHAAASASQPASKPASASQPASTPQTTAAQKGPKTYQVGEAVQIKNSNGVFTETLSQAHYTTTPGNQFSTPQHGGWLVATVDIVVVSGHTPFNPLYYTLIGPDGSRWDADLTTAGYAPALASGDLSAGDKAHGYIAFDAPSTATGSGAKISVSDPLLSVVAYWSL